MLPGGGLLGWDTQNAFLDPVKGETDLFDFFLQTVVRVKAGFLMPVSDVEMLGFEVSEAR